MFPLPWYLLVANSYPVLRRATSFKHGVILAARCVLEPVFFSYMYKKFPRIFGRKNIPPGQFFLKKLAHRVGPPVTSFCTEESKESIPAFTCVSKTSNPYVKIIIRRNVYQCLVCFLRVVVIAAGLVTMYYVVIKLVYVVKRDRKLKKG